MPRTSHKVVVAAVVSLLLGSAMYLIAVRGPALLMDLSSLAGLICF